MELFLIVEYKVCFNDHFSKINKYHTYRHQGQPKRNFTIGCEQVLAFNYDCECIIINGAIIHTCVDSFTTECYHLSLTTNLKWCESELLIIKHQGSKITFTSFGIFWKNKKLKHPT